MFDGHYFQLLVAELLYKNDCQQTNRKDLLRAVVYFDNLIINQDGKALTVSYGIDRQRVQQTFTDGDNVRTKRYFTPLYERVTENGVTKNLHYLTAETGLFAIFVTQNNGE